VILRLLTVIECLNHCSVLHSILEELECSGSEAVKLSKNILLSNMPELLENACVF
jgi:hypothetical protein